MEHTRFTFTSGSAAERRLIYAMNAPGGLDRSESHDTPAEKSDFERMDSLLPNADELSQDPDAEVTVEEAAVHNTDEALEAPRIVLDRARAALEEMQTGSVEQTEGSDLETKIQNLTAQMVSRLHTQYPDLINDEVQNAMREQIADELRSSTKTEGELSPKLDIDALTKRLPTIALLDIPEDVGRVLTEIEDPVDRARRILSLGIFDATKGVVEPGASTNTAEHIRSDTEQPAETYFDAAIRTFEGKLDFVPEEKRGELLKAFQAMPQEIQITTSLGIDGISDPNDKMAYVRLMGRFTPEHLNLWRRLLATNPDTINRLAGGENLQTVLRDVQSNLSKEDNQLLEQFFDGISPADARLMRLGMEHASATINAQRTLSGEQPDVPPLLPDAMPDDPETARLTTQINESIQELQQATTPGEALAAIGKLFAAITEMIRRIFAKDTVKDVAGGADTETASGDASEESAAEQAPEQDERVRSAGTLEERKEALAAVDNESRETLESNNTTIKELDAVIGELEGQKTTLDEQIATLQSQIDSAGETEGSAKLRILQTQLEGLKKQAVSLQETIDAHTTHRTELVEENEALQQKIEAAERAKDRVGFTLDAMHKIEKVLQETFGIEAHIKLDEGNAIFVVTKVSESTPEWLRVFLRENDQDQKSDNGYQIDVGKAGWLSQKPVEESLAPTEKGGIDTIENAESPGPVAEAERIIASMRKTIADGKLPSQQDLRGLHDALRAVQDRSDEEEHLIDQDAEDLRKILEHDRTIFTGSAGDRYQLLRGDGDRYTLVSLDESNVGTPVVTDEQLDAPPENLRIERGEWASSIKKKALRMEYPITSSEVQPDGSIAITFDTEDENYTDKLHDAQGYAIERGIFHTTIDNVLTVKIEYKHENNGYFGADFTPEQMDAFRAAAAHKDVFFK